MIQGASSGLGKVLTFRYAMRGCPMVISARSEEQLQEIVKRCHRQFNNKQVYYKVADATKEKDCKELVDFAISKFSRIDLMVLAAGVGAHSYFRDLQSVDVVKQVMDVNFNSALYMTRHALPTLRESKGQIVVVSSMSGEIPLQMRSAYCAAKAATNHFFRSLRLEEMDIRVSIMILDTFKGSNFRDNSLVKVEQMEKRSSVLEVDDVAD